MARRTFCARLWGQTHKTKVAAVTVSLLETKPGLGRGHTQQVERRDSFKPTCALSTPAGCTLSRGPREDTAVEDFF